ncbi:hypothetical protein N7456_010436 [Penicillium angulare]|uniref:F-box domain-containing protein n=1 Tax=Penicillium angulare TaxID=116970 RepID=A0A9W9K6I0_9EURO|nr:hypothetical protein N7456_010436 [Penicillium angulare]
MFATLGDLPFEIFEMITTCLDDLTLVNLYRTCKGFRFFLQAERDKRARQGFLAPASDFTNFTDFKFPEGFNVGVDLPTKKMLSNEWNRFINFNWQPGFNFRVVLFPQPPPVIPHLRNDDLPFEGYLVHTIKNRQIDALRALLDLGANPDSYSSANRFLLWYAVESGDINIVKLLLERGAIAHKIPTFHILLNPLSRALELQNTEIIHLLFEDGADISSIAGDIVGLSSIEFIRKALQKGMRLEKDNTALDRVVRRGDRDIFDLILPIAASCGALIKGNQIMRLRANLPLHIALEENRPEMALALIAAGINLNVTSLHTRQTALHIALWRDHLHIAREIISAGCRLNIRDIGNCAELHNALQIRRHRHKMPYPVFHEVTTRDEQRTTPPWPVNVELSAERLSIISLLLEKGADVNMHGGLDNGVWNSIGVVESPLIYGVRFRNRALVQLFLAHRADLALEILWHETPLQVAESLGYSEIADMLR